MNLDLRTKMEIAFNIFYLAFIWYLVIRMYIKLPRIRYDDRGVSKYFAMAFLFLALGDSGHVGFRIVAYMRGGLEANSSLVGYGALASAVTVTIFYIMMLFVWAERFNEKLGVLGFTILAIAIVRFILLLPSQNQWSSVVPPHEWSLYRNMPLMIVGIGIAFLMLLYAIDCRDKVFKWISYMIFISFACYIPVVLYVQDIPGMGMLMIPKTIAYVAMGVIGYKELFNEHEKPMLKY